MAFWNINSGAAVTTYDADGNPVGIDNDNGAIRHGGTIASSRFESKALDVGNIVPSVISGVDGITGVLGGGVFNGGDQVIVKYTTDLAGISNTALLFGSSNSANVAKSINQLAVLETKLYKTAVRNGQWDIYDGAFSPAVTVVNSGAWDVEASIDTSATMATSGTDDAANPTRLVPGELVYTYGSGSAPTTDEYKAKDIW